MQNLSTTCELLLLSSRNISVLPISDIIDPTFSLHLVGGYEDEAGKAAKLTSKIVDFFNRFDEADVTFMLRTICVGKPNTKKGRYGHNEPKIGT